MHGSMVKLLLQPGLGLTDHWPVTQPASLGPIRVFRRLAARSFDRWTSRRLVATGILWWGYLYPSVVLVYDGFGIWAAILIDLLVVQTDDM